MLLASFCAGGLIALEMAARLAEQGRPVKHLVLIDPPIRKNGTLGFGASPLQPDLAHRTKRLLQRLLPRPLRLRYYDLKWNKSIRSKNSALGLSTAAQAKLYAAFSDYRIRHSGPVTILTSRGACRGARVRMRIRYCPTGLSISSSDNIKRSPASLASPRRYRRPSMPLLPKADQAVPLAAVS